MRASPRLRSPPAEGDHARVRSSPAQDMAAWCPGLARIGIFPRAGTGGMLAAPMSSDWKDAMEPGFAAAEIDTSKPHPARMYNAYLGGNDNYPADRAAVRQILRDFPEVPAIALVILSFRVSRFRDLRRPVMDGVADGTPAGRSQCYWWN
jgi:S-adenosyl methyltransferase